MRKEIKQKSDELEKVMLAQTQLIQQFNQSQEEIQMIETHTKMEGEVIITNFQVRFPTTLLQQQDQIRCGGVSFCIAVTHPSTEGKVL